MISKSCVLYRSKMIRQFKALWDSRDITRYLVTSELKVLYRNKALGYLWSLLEPLCMMGVYILLVAVIFQRGGPQYPVLVFSAILAWWWFTFSVTGSVTSISGKAKLIQTLYFPKGVLPLEKAITGLVRYLTGLIALVPLLFIFEAQWSLNVLWMPVLIFVQLLLTIGCCFFFAALGVYFRDLQNILRFLIRAWFFISPALYSVADRVPERFQGIYMLNPFAALFESYKNVLVLGMPPDKYVFIAAALGVVILLGGLELFARKEPDLAKAA
jgi:ABC-type polysaccharide/polyol phosphate export permease